MLQSISLSFFLFFVFLFTSNCRGHIRIRVSRKSENKVRITDVRQLRPATSRAKHKMVLETSLSHAKSEIQWIHHICSSIDRHAYFNQDQ